MDVMILCGGYGTRMGAVTGRIPKPMVPVGGQPLLWHVMQIYARQGHTRFLLCVGHLGERIRDWARAHAPSDWEVVLVDTGADTPTGGRLLAASEHLRGPRCMATYGDGVADLDLSALLAFHTRQGTHATLSAMHPRSRFGVVELAGGKVQAFDEKPLLRQRVSGGFFVFEREAFAQMRGDEALELGALSRLAAQGQLSGYEHDGFWMSVDTPRDLQALNASWDQGERPWL
ncbi:MAG: sugar phosphate nucleotidyltransferase [Myxococcota bacterium]|nr:sugar phosphate nucleotidyltransferase [Myxococcota bacterium]